MSSCHEGHCAIGPVMCASGRSRSPNLGSINTGFSVGLSVYLTFVSTFARALFESIPGARVCCNGPHTIARGEGKLTVQPIIGRGRAEAIVAWACLVLEVWDVPAIFYGLDGLAERMT